MGQKLGQHFLINKKAIEVAILALELKPGDFVVEIGPGKGVLTLPLAQKLQDLSGKLVAIEKDPALVDNLLRNQKTWNKKHGTGGGIEFISGDALKILVNPQFLEKLPQNWKIIGNIPYYITGHLLRILGETENRPEITVLMVQNEVAERVTAKPPHMNLLAAATQVWADISIVFRLKQKDFDPPPEVESAIIKLKIKSANWRTKLKIEELRDYYRFIHAAFRQPRKTLLNNIAEGYDLKKDAVLSILEKSGFNEKTRAQELGIEELLRISNYSNF